MSSNTPVCEGEWAQLSAVPTNGTAPYSYAWSGPGGFTSGNANPGFPALLSSSGNYSVTVTDVNGCTGMNSHFFSVSAEPSCSIGGQPRVCTESTGNTYVGPGGVSSYTWTVGGNGTIAGPSNTQNVSVAALGAGNYTLTLTVSNVAGCTNTCSRTVVVDPLPPCLVLGPDDVCASSSGHAYTGPAGMSFYSWSISGNGSIAGAANGQTVLVNASGSAGSYTLTLLVADGNNCSSSCTKTTTVSALPVCSVTGPMVVCAGSKGNSHLGPVGSVFYAWTISGNGIISGGTQQQEVLVDAYNPGSYMLTVTATDVSGCSSSCSQMVTIVANPTATAGSDQDICELQNVQIGSSPQGGITYSWSPSTGLSSTVVANPFANPLTTTNYTVTVTNADGCSATDNVIVTVKPVPVVPSLPNVGPLCPNTGQSVPPVVLTSLPPSAGTVFNWSVTSDGSDIINNATQSGSVLGLNPIISGMLLTGNEGTATVTVTASLNGCTGASTSYNITVQDNNGLHFSNCPASTITRPNTQGQCSAIVTWAAPVALDDCSTGAGIVVTQTSNPGGYGPGSSYPVGTNVTIIYDANDGNGNTAQCSFQVQVSDVEPPVITCPADVTVNANAGSCSWLSNSLDPTISDNCNNLNLSFIVSGATSLVSPATGLNYANGLNLAVGDNTVCYLVKESTDPGNNGLLSASCCMHVTVQNPVTAGAVLLRSCSTYPGGNTGTFDLTTLSTAVANAQPGVSVTYHETLAAAQAGTNVISGANVYTTTSRIVYARVTNTTGCHAESVVQLVVVNGPQLLSTVTDESCAGLNDGRVDLTTIGGDVPYLYDWLDLGGNNNPSNRIGLPPGNYNVTVTDANGCMATASANVGSHPNPTVSTSHNGPLCEGSLAQMNAVPANGTAPYSYQWSGPAGFSSGNANPSFPATVALSGTYTVTVTDGNGCTGTNSHSFQVNANPPCSIAGQGRVCAGSASNPYSAPGGGSSYSWIVAGNGAIAGPANGPTVNVTALGPGNFTLTLTVTSSASCTSTCSRTIIVDPLPVCLISGADEVCAGSPGHIYSAPPGMSVYSWSISGNGSIAGATNGQNLVVNASGSAGSYTLTLVLVDGNNCSSSCTKVVTVGALPACTVTGPMVVCAGSKGNSYLGPLGSVFYTWSISGNGLISGGSQQQEVLVDAYTPGSYTLTVSATDADGCTSSCSQLVTVVANPVASAGPDQSICEFDNIQIGSSPQGGTLYSWTPATGLSSSTVANPFADPLVTTTYTVTATNANGCTATDVVTVTVKPVPVVPALPNIGPLCPNSGNSVPAVILTSIPPAAGTVFNWSVTSDGSDIINNGTQSGSVLGSNPLITGMLLTGNEGTATVTVTATLNGCTSAPKSYTITAQDNNGLHFVNCPVATIARPNTLGQCNAIVTWTAPLALDDCSTNGGIIVTQTSSPGGYGPGSSYPVGQLVTITYTADDGNGNTATCAFQVRVDDIEPPVISCPADVTVNANTAGCTWLSNSMTPTISDNCGNLDLTYMVSGATSLSSAPTGINYAQGFPMNIGANQICYTLKESTDPGGNGVLTATCCVHVTVRNPVSAGGAVVKACPATPGGGTGTFNLTAADPTVVGGQGSVAVLYFETLAAAQAGSPAIGTPLAYTSESKTIYARVTHAISGCFATSAIQLVVTASPQPLAWPTDESCAGANDGAVALTVIGGDAPFSYDWADIAGPANPANRTGLAPGTYTVTVTDANGCTGSATATVGSHPNPTVTASNNGPLCAGNWAQLSAVPSNGSAPYGYAWSGPGGFTSGNANPGFQATVASSGTYTVTVTDVNGCTGTNTTVLTVNANPSVNNVVLMVCPTTPGGDYGQFNLTHAQNPAAASNSSGLSVDQAGSNTVTYHISQLDAQNDINGFSIINNYLTQTSIVFARVEHPSTGCYSVASVSLIVKDSPAASASSNSPVCVGEQLELYGSPAGMNYSWSGPGGFSSNSQSPVVSANATTGMSGIYFLTVTDPVTGCTNQATVNVVVHPNPVANAGPDVAICLGSSIQIGGTPTGAGGLAGYFYAWSPAAGLSNTDIGNPIASPAVTTVYTVTVTDLNGCTGTDQVTVTVNPNPVANAGQDMTICEGQSAVIGGAPTASGGSPGYTYSWIPASGLNNSGVANPVASPVATTNYTVLVTDVLGCTATDVMTVTVNKVPIVTAVPDVGPLCPNAGSLVPAIVLASFPPAANTSFNWVVSSEVNDVISNATSTGTATGANPIINSIALTGNEGIATVSVIATLNSCTSAPITFNITVEDSNGLHFTNCPTSPILRANDPGVCSAIINWVAPSAIDDCSGSNNIVVAQTSNPEKSPGVAYGPNDAFPVGVTVAIIYTANDGNGNTTTCSFSVKASDEEAPEINCPADLTMAANAGNCSWLSAGLTPVVSDNCNTYDVSYTVSGTTLAASPLTGLNYANAINFNIGTSKVCYTVKENTDPDGNGKLSTTCCFDVTVENPVTAAGAMLAVCSNNPVGNTGTFDLTQATPTVQGGQSGVNVTYHETYLAAENGTLAIANPSGYPSISRTIFARVTNANGCYNIASVQLAVNQSPQLIYSVTQLSCAGAGNGAIDLTVIGGDAPYLYDWDNDGTGDNNDPQDLNNLNAGTYSVTVTDANGCTGTATIVIGSPAGLVASHTKTDVTCYGGGNGAINLTVSGGSIPYLFDWSNGAQDVEDPNGLSAGSYQVTVTDAKGCTLVYGPVTIGQPNAFSITFTNVVNASCNGGHDGTATANVTGGTTPYLIVWSNGQANNNITQLTATGLGAGGYSVTVTDANGCQAFASLNITEPTQLNAVISNLTNVGCQGANSGNASVLASGGTPPYVYDWSNDGTGDFNDLPTVTGLSVGTYTVTVRDAKGCETVRSVTIDEPTALLGNIIQLGHETCSGSHDGTATVSVTGGTTPYTYDWSNDGPDNPDNDLPTASGLAPGTYTVTVTDAKGCSITASATILPGQTLIVNALANIGPLCPGELVPAIALNAVPVDGNTVFTWGGGAAVGLADGTAAGINPFIPSFAASNLTGSATVSVVATRNGCVSAPVTFTITVEDDEDPVFITCPGAIVVATAPDQCGANVNFTLPTAYDNCGTATVAQTDLTGLTSGSFFPTGPTNLVFRATDGTGNTAICNVTVTVLETQKPNAVCKNINVALDNNGLATIVPSAIDGGSTDNCTAPANLALSISNNAFNCGNVGPNQVVLTVADQAGNTATCQSTVTVQDLLAPAFTCPTSPVNIPGCDGLVPNLIAGITNAADNCSPVVLSQTPLPGVSIGNTSGNSVNVVITAADPSGNTTTCTVAVVIVDNIAPHFVNCPDTIKVANDPDQCSAIVNWPAPVAMDNCSPLTVMQTGGPTSGSTLPVGPPATVTYQATDGNGNNITCAFQVQVLDKQKPVFATTMPLDETVQCNAIPAPFVFVPSLHASDNCTAPGSIQFTFVETSSQNADPFACNHYNFILQRTWKITDQAGNFRMYTQNIYVKDDTAPTFTTPVDITIDCDDSILSMVTTAQDNCAPFQVLAITFTDQSTQLPSTANCGHYNYTVTRTWTVADPCGNSSSAQQIITVKDNTPPVVTCNDLTVELGATGLAIISANSINAGTTDNCAPVANLTLSIDKALFNCDDLGANQVVLQAKDPCGNTSTCNATVTVQDNSAPSLTCPANIFVNLGPGACESIVYFSPSFSDNCDVDLVATPASGESFPIGINTVNVTATDGAGNQVACSFNVNVIEFVPTVSGITCNELVQVSLDASCEAEITADMILEGSNYGCYGDFTVTILNSLGAPIPTSPVVNSNYIGKTLTVKVLNPDNGLYCWGEIYVEDKLAPEIACPADLTLNCNVSSDPPGATGIPTLLSCETQVTMDHLDVFHDFGCADPVLQIERTWTFTDSSGNASSCTQLISYRKPNLSEVVFPIDLDAVTGNALSCTAVQNNPNLPKPEYAGGRPRLNGIPITPGGVCNFAIGYADLILDVCAGGSSYEILRTWTVRDLCLPLQPGVNPIQHLQSIHVLDMTGPTINCPPTASISTSGVDCQGQYILPTVSIQDNCSGVQSVTVSGPLGEITGNVVPNLPVGIHPITYVAFDNCGNFTTCTTQLTVADATKPVVVCDEITDVNLSVDGIATVYAATFDDGSYDGCCLDHFLVRKMVNPCNPADTLFKPAVTFCCEDIAINPVMVVFRAVDCYGNYNDCMVQVNVNDKSAPIRTFCPPDKRITCDWYADNLETQLQGLTGAQQCQYLIDKGFGEATFEDNCPFTVNCNTTINLDQCLEGVITRTFSAVDASGNAASQNCTTRIFVDHVSDWVVEFPADITVNCGTSAPDFGEPEIFFETCELVAISYEDELFNVVQGACYKILRTWKIINWCVVGNNIDEEVVEQPENQLGLAFPLCDLDGDGDCDARTFRDSWNSTAKPGAAQATQTTNPDSDLDSDPWDGYITYQQTIKVIDNVDPVFVDCSIDTVCIEDNGCSINLQLPIPVIDECSYRVTIAAQIKFGGVYQNAGTVVLENGTTTDVFMAFPNVGPGTYDVRYVAMDNCNNQTDCETTVTVKDCKNPTPYCKDGLILEMMQTGMVQTWASDFDAGSFDNCPGGLHFSFSPSLADSGLVYTCDSLGLHTVNIYVTDAQGNQDFCVTQVEVQANQGQCFDDTLHVHFGGHIKTEQNEGVANVEVQLNGDMQNSMMTDNSGLFNFSVPMGGDYSITPVKDDNPLNGVTTFDLVLISKHILGIQALNSPYKLIAADANKSGTVTTFDLVTIRKVILFIDTEFLNNTSWRFVDKDFVFPNPLNPWLTVFPEIINVNNITADELSADFVAVKIGDVNSSAVPNFAAGSDDRSKTGKLVFTVDDVQLTAGQEYTVAFKASDFKVLGYQFTLNFDSKALAFNDVVPGIANIENFGLTMVDKGAITSSWNDDNATVANGEPVFSLVFKAIANVRLSEVLSVNSRYTKAEAYKPNGDLLEVELVFNGAAAARHFELYQNMPNPFSNYTVIGFNLPEAATATLTVTDVSGKVVKSVKQEFAKGFNEIRLERRELPATGILYYQLDTPTDSATKMMLLMD
ncbi:MAG: HYR domain-containing protein [Saprospiraceae bacterium]